MVYFFFTHILIIVEFDDLAIIIDLPICDWNSAQVKSHENAIFYILQFSDNKCVSLKIPKYIALYSHQLLTAKNLITKN